MAKYLKDVLKGKKESTKKVNDLGGYKPKAGDEEEFAKKHEIEKHEDRVGNGDDVYNASNVKPALNRPEEKRHKDAGEVYESKKDEDTKCNMSEAGTYCPMHEMANCSSMRNIKELSTDTYHSAAQKAAKRAMGDAMGRSGPIFKKYAGMANKFRAKGMEQEKQEKAMKENILPGTFVEPSASAKNKAKKVQQKDADNAVVSRAKMGMTTEERMPHQMDSGELRQHLATHYGHIEHGSYVSPQKLRTYKYHVNRLAKMIGKSTEHVRNQVKKDHGVMDDMHEGAKVDRMVAHVKSSEKAADKSDKKAENIAWATANKRGMLDNKNKKTNEANAVEPLLQDNDHKNEEGEMARTELKALANKALHLVMKMPESMHVEPWCQAKIAQAKSMINDVHDYMIYGEHDKEENESDTPMDITTASNPSNSFSSMSVDVGRNV